MSKASWQAETADVEAIVAGQSANPFGILGLHEVRREMGRPDLHPQCRDGRRLCLGRDRARPPDPAPSGRLLRRPRADQGTLPDPLPREELGRRVGRQRSLLLRAGARADGRLLHRRGHAPSALRQARRPRDDVRGCRRHPLCGLGAQCAAGQRRRPVQRVGRPAPSDAAAARDRHLGGVHPGARAGHALQVRDRRAGRQADAAQGRSLGAAVGDAAQDGLGRCPIRRPSPGPTQTTSRSARSTTGGGRRCRSTRSTSARGASGPTAAS